jgi:DNA-directed RNA polymerase subunit omega
MLSISSPERYPLSVLPCATQSAIQRLPADFESASLKIGLLGLESFLLHWGVTLTYSARRSMQKRPVFDTNQIMRRAEELINASSNRYRITVQVASRAKKRRRRENLEDFDDGGIKAVMHAILEMSDELTQPEIIGD